MMNLVTFCIAFLMYNSFTSLNDLKRFKGVNPIFNRAKILKIVEDLKLNLIDNKTEIITLSIDDQAKAIIILDHEDILINIEQVRRYTSPTLFGAALAILRLKNELLLEEKLASFFKKIETLAQPQPF